MFLKRILFLVTYLPIRLCALLPFSVLYKISDLLSFLLFRVFNYRTKVIESNLRIAFPLLSPEGRAEIKQRFFRHFTDLFVESLKNGFLSSTEFKNRFTVYNASLLDASIAKGKNVIVLLAHHGNWEWTAAIPLFTPHPVYGIYQKLNNPFFDRFIRKTRGAAGMHLVPTFELKQTMDTNIKLGKSGVYGLISDQSPMIKKTKHWFQFFTKTVPVHTGAEELARAYSADIVLLSIRKVNRGFYSATFLPFEPQIDQSENYQITETYLKWVEREIVAQPETYLWTHKRFKHSR